MNYTPPTVQTGHVGLNVTDVSRSTDFYRRVLGLELLSEGTDERRRYAFLGLAGALVLTLWQQSDGRFVATAPGMHHLSFQVPDMPAVRRVEGMLRELDAPFAYDGVVAHAEAASSGGIFFEDPDGIRLEVYATSGAHGLPVPVPGAPTCGFF